MPRSYYPAHFTCDTDTSPSNAKKHPFIWSPLDARRLHASLLFCISRLRFRFVAAECCAVSHSGALTMHLELDLRMRESVVAWRALKVARPIPFRHIIILKVSGEIGPHSLRRICIFCRLHSLAWLPCFRQKRVI